MRISDWSSDVCSSDLPEDLRLAVHELDEREEEPFLEASDLHLARAERVLALLLGAVDVLPDALVVDGARRLKELLVVQRARLPQHLEADGHVVVAFRSAERVGGTECVRPWRSRGSR